MFIVSVNYSRDHIYTFRGIFNLEKLKKIFFIDLQPAGAQAKGFNTLFILYSITVWFASPQTTLWGVGSLLKKFRFEAKLSETETVLLAFRFSFAKPQKSFASFC